VLFSPLVPLAIGIHLQPLNAYKVNISLLKSAMIRRPRVPRALLYFYRSIFHFNFMPDYKHSSSSERYHATMFVCQGRVSCVCLTSGFPRQSHCCNFVSFRGRSGPHHNLRVTRAYADAMESPKEYDLEYWLSKVEIQRKANKDNREGKDKTRTPGPPTAT
jgi:hypothetical protein